MPVRSHTDGLSLIKDLGLLTNDPTYSTVGTGLDVLGAGIDQVRQLGEEIVAELKEVGRLVKTENLADDKVQARLHDLGASVRNRARSIRVGEQYFRVVSDVSPEFGDLVESLAASGQNSALLRTQSLHALKPAERALKLRESAVELVRSTGFFSINEKTLLAVKPYAKALTALNYFVVAVPLVPLARECLTAKTPKDASSACGKLYEALVGVAISAGLGVGVARLIFVVLPVVGGGWTVAIAGVASVVVSIAADEAAKAIVASAQEIFDR